MLFKFFYVGTADFLNEISFFSPIALSKSRKISCIFCKNWLKILSFVTTKCECLFFIFSLIFFVLIWLKYVFFVYLSFFLGIWNTYSLNKLFLFSPVTVFKSKKIVGIFEENLLKHFSLVSTKSKFTWRTLFKMFISLFKFLWLQFRVFFFFFYFLISFGFHDQNNNKNKKIKKIFYCPTLMKVTLTKSVTFSQLFIEEVAQLKSEKWSS